jgi:hypothetical protein
MATKTRSRITPEIIQNAYVKYVLTELNEPTSVFAFAEMIGITEGEFYKHYNSFESVEAAVWNDLMSITLNRLKNDENYAAFSAREKLLAFFYTHLEVLLDRRSFVCKKWPDVKSSLRTPKVFESYKNQFMDFAKEVVNEAIEKEEIKYRAMLSERYDKAFWLQLVFIVDYWRNDDSKGFEQSDAAVEKAVNLAFQLLGETALDGAIDFAKFLWQRK